MMFARMLGIFAQFERELIQERTLVGVESAIKKGHFGSSKTALGYKKETINGEKGKNKTIAEIVDLKLYVLKIKNVIEKDK